MGSSFLDSQPFSGTTSQSAQLATDSSGVMIAGLGEKGFQFYSEGVWQPADTVMDNGMQRGYSVYCGNDLVGCGKLVVYDEIDKEMDVLDGGAISYGWVTNFPADYVSPSRHSLARYEKVKKAFRKDFTTWPLLEFTDADATSSVGQGVYRLAASDPSTQYGLGKTDKSQKTDFSLAKFSVGFNGTSHRLPTITSDWNYYSDLLSAEKMLRPPTLEGDDDVVSNASSVAFEGDD